MALSMDDDRPTGAWLGLTPAVLIALAAVVLLGGAGYAVAERGDRDGLAGTVVQMCEESNAWRKRWGESYQTNLPSQRLATYALGVQARDHVSALEAAGVEGAEVATRDELLAAERDMVAVAGAVQAWAGPAVDRGQIPSGITDATMAAWHKAKVLSGRYERRYGIADCSQ